MTEVSYTYARAHLAELWDKVIDEQEPVVLTRRGAEDVVLVPADEFRSLAETVRLLANPANGIPLLTALQRAYARTEPPTDLRLLREELGLYDDSEREVGHGARSRPAS